MESKHTPGPWAYSGYEDHCDVGREYHEIVDADGFEIINQNGIVTSKEDARLIAAAPEMLEALEMIDRAWCGDGVDMAQAVDACLLALQKARS